MMQELSAARTDMATVVEGFFDGTFGSKGIDRDGLVVRLRSGLHLNRACMMGLPVLQLRIHGFLDFPALAVQDMLVDIAGKQDQTHLTAEHLEAGLKLVIDSLDQTYIDVPFAPKLVRPAAEISVPRVLSSRAMQSCPFCGAIKWLGYQFHLLLLHW